MTLLKTKVSLLIYSTTIIYYIALESLWDSSLSENDEETVNKVLKHYKNHPSVAKIKYNQNETLNFDSHIEKILSNFIAT